MKSFPIYQIQYFSNKCDIWKKKRNELSDHKGPENINSTIVKYGETFYGHHTAPTAAIVKIYSKKSYTHTVI